jgi:hypothetical protein
MFGGNLIMKIAMRMLVVTIIIASSSFALGGNIGVVGGGGPIPMPPVAALSK